MLSVVRNMHIGQDLRRHFPRATRQIGDTKIKPDLIQLSGSWFAVGGGVPSDCLNWKSNRVSRARARERASLR